MKNMVMKFMLAILIASLFIGCKTVDLEETRITNEFVKDDTELPRELEELMNEEELEALLAMQGEDAEVYSESPEGISSSPQNIITDDEEKAEVKREAGKTAVNKSLEKATIEPEHYKNGTFVYKYNEDNVYEVYAQLYHLTDILLEPGELVIGTPLLSEDETVWELTAVVGRDVERGEDVQHLFIKPAYSGLDSSLVVITDRRVYHFRIKSFKDTHMAMVKFTYPRTRNVWLKSPMEKNSGAGGNAANDISRVSNPEFLSFDYKITYSKYKAPEFLPTRVYDDGQATYVQLSDTVLQKKLPLIFNDKTEITNYAVRGNVLVIPRLVNRLTLRLGKEKVMIQKKRN